MALIGSTKTRPQARRVLVATLLVVGLSRATAALADFDPVELAVVDRDTGQPLPIWRHQGRLFITGEPGRRYGLRVTNHTNGRVLVVLSVDGVNVITGQTAGYGQRGYVFNAFESYDVTGWRKSDSEVAAFTFAPLPQSYAARTGRPGDVGVIGMAVFRERTPFRLLDAERKALPAPRPARPLAAPSAVPAPPPLVVLPAPRAGSASEAVITGSRLARRHFGSDNADEKLGTGHGAREWSTSTIVTFVRATALSANHSADRIRHL